MKKKIEKQYQENSVMLLKAERILFLLVALFEFVLICWLSSQIK